MELQFRKTGIPCLKDILREPKNQEQTQELRLPEAYPDVGRVLGAFGVPVLRGKEWRRKEISVSAGITVWVLYVPEDGSPGAAALAAMGAKSISLRRLQAAAEHP